MCGFLIGVIAIAISEDCVVTLLRVVLQKSCTSNGLFALAEAHSFLGADGATGKDVCCTNGDVVLERTSSLAPPGTLFEITPAIDPAGNPIGVSTIFVTSQTKITSNLKVGDIISWPDETKPLNSDGSFSPTFNRVTSINPNGKEFQVGAVSTVTNYVNGGLYDGGAGGFSNNSQRTNVNKVSNAVYGSPDDESLLVSFNNTVLSSVDLENNQITEV